MAERHEEEDRGRVGLASPLLLLTGRQGEGAAGGNGSLRGASTNERELVGGDSCYLSPFPPMLPLLYFDIIVIVAVAWKIVNQCCRESMLTPSSQKERERLGEQKM